MPVPKIHCIGDSHISFFSGMDGIQPVWPEEAESRLPQFRVYHIGPALAFSLHREGTRSQGREKLYAIIENRTRKNDHILLSFGEIDCRAHLVKQSERNGRTLEETVAACLDSYFEVVVDLVTRGYRVIVYNAVPSYPRTRKPANASPNAYATFGTLEQRNRAVQLFNEGARRRCAEHGAVFLKNADRVCDSSGKSKQWYFFDSIHLSQRAMPATLMELAKLFPEWEMNVPPIPVPDALSLFRDRAGRRIQRIWKEIKKGVALFQGS